MFFVYVLHSKKDNNLYIGYSEDVHKRVTEHHAACVDATKHRRPLELIYYEAYIKQADALGREKFLKSGSGHRYLKKQLVSYYEDLSRPVK